MPLEHTLSIIKPDAVAKNIIGSIYKRFEDAGLSIVAARMVQLSQEQAEKFIQSKDVLGIKSTSVQNPGT